jgi:predicted nuclease with TOPRIM domain
MGALKDIVDLCVKLRDEVGDRKAAEVVGKIQSLTLTLQSEQAAIVERDTALMERNAKLVSENLEFERKTSELQQQIKKLEKENVELQEKIPVRACAIPIGKPPTPLL